MSFMGLVSFIREYILAFFLLVLAMGFTLYSATSDNIYWFYLAIILFLASLYFFKKPKFG